MNALKISYLFALWCFIIGGIDLAIVCIKNLMKMKKDYSYILNKEKSDGN